MPKRIECPKCKNYADTLFKRQRQAGKIKLVAVGYQCNMCGFVHFDLTPQHITSQRPLDHSTVTPDQLKEWYPIHIEVEYQQIS